MDWLVAAGWAASACTSTAALVRWVETSRSKHVDGVAPAFAWLGLLGNVAWLSYGLAKPEYTQLPPSILFICAFSYVLYRVHVEGRNQVRNLAVVSVPMVGIILTAVMVPEVVAYLGGAIVISSTLPQLVKIYRTKDREGVGPVAWSATLIMSALWITYGVGSGIPEIWIPNAIFAVLNVGILAGWARAGRSEKVAT